MTETTYTSPAYTLGSVLGYVISIHVSQRGFIMTGIHVTADQFSR